MSRDIDNESFEAAAKILATKFHPKSRYGKEDEEKVTNFKAALKETIDEQSSTKIGIIKLASLLEVSSRTLYLAIDRGKLKKSYNKPKPKSGQKKTIDITHPDFLDWWTNEYERMEPKPNTERCKFNELLEDEDGKLLPKYKRPKINGEPIEPCDKPLSRSRSKFCSQKHYLAYIKISTDGQIFSEIGTLGANSQRRMETLRKQREKKQLEEEKRQTKHRGVKLRNLIK